MKLRSNIWMIGVAVLAVIMMVLVWGQMNDYVLNQDASEEDLQSYRITMVAKSTESVFWKSLIQGAKAASTEYNVELTIVSPDNEEDYEKQNALIREAREEEKDAIILSAIDYDGNAQAVQETIESGIPVVGIDSKVNVDGISVFIGTDNYKAGQTAGEQMLLGEETELNIGIVGFDINSENGQSREKGFVDTVTTDDRVTIVDKIYVLSTVEDAKKKTMELIEEHPEMNAIVTFNEWTSLGVGEAVSECGKEDTIRLIAFDGNVESVDKLEAGVIDALIVQNSYAIGYLGIENAVSELGGRKDLPEVIDTEVQIVTKDNMYTKECQRILFLLGSE